MVALKLQGFIRNKMKLFVDFFVFDGAKFLSRVELMC